MKEIVLAKYPNCPRCGERWNWTYPSQGECLNNKLNSKCIVIWWSSVDDGFNLQTKIGKWLTFWIEEKDNLTSYLLPDDAPPFPVPTLPFDIDEAKLNKLLNLL